MLVFINLSQDYFGLLAHNWTTCLPKKKICGAMVARLTPDQKVVCSNHIRVKPQHLLYMWEGNAKNISSTLVCVALFGLSANNWKQTGCLTPACSNQVRVNVEIHQDSMHCEVLSTVWWVVLQSLAQQSHVRAKIRRSHKQIMSLSN